MSKPVPAGWDGHRLYVRIYGREPDAERRKRMRRLWRHFQKIAREEGRDELRRRRKELEEEAIPNLSRKVERLEEMIRQVARDADREAVKDAALLKPFPGMEGFAAPPMADPVRPAGEIVEALLEVCGVTGGWTGDRLKGRPEEGMLAERNQLREKHARNVEELSVLSAFLDRPTEPETETDETAEQVEEIARAFRKLEPETVKGWRYKKDLKDWMLQEFGLSYTQGQRLLEEANVWVKGKKGQPGAGLQETLERLKDYRR